MKLWILPLLMIVLYACGSAKSAPELKPTEMIIKDEITDTCFYAINPGADLDVPGTPSWDTTIVRAENCQIQVLKLRSWGTETTYTMAGPENKKTVTRECHCFGGSGIIDITDIPAGTYSFGLLACGNGGSFSVKIQ
jgi:hypothetical protein